MECGVFKGVGMIYWRKLLEIYSSGSSKRVIGFDTFSGYSDSCLSAEVEKKHKFRFRNGKHQFLCGKTLVVEGTMCVGVHIHTFCPNCGDKIETPCCMRAIDVDFELTPA